MKKVSISLFAVLAIVFAVVSAFSTASEKRATDSWVIQANNAPVPSSYLPTGCADGNFEQQDIPGLGYNLVNSKVTANYTLAELIAFEAAHCASVTPNRVCFVALKFKDGVQDPAFAASPVITPTGSGSCYIAYGRYF